MCRFEPPSFPGQNAGASLKFQQTREEYEALVDLPRPERRGLIEVSGLRPGRALGYFAFPGQNAGASLKLPRRTVRQPQAPSFPGQNAGASLKSSHSVLLLFPPSGPSPARTPGPH